MAGLRLTASMNDSTTNYRLEKAIYILSENIDIIPVEEFEKLAEKYNHKNIG